jgi:hypothetical protein
MFPITVKEHDGILVVRDDLLEGGTKARFLTKLFSKHDEMVYASTAPGGAQLALAYSARAMGKKATLFVAERKQYHERTLEAIAVGAAIHPQKCGYLSNLQAKARKYCEATGTHYLELGCPEAEDAIAEAAARVHAKYGPFDQVWSAAGSGVLTRGLQAGIPGADFFAVRTGRKVEEVGRARAIDYPMDFHDELEIEAPFPSCPNIDRKAWQVCRERSHGRALFWNVLGPSPTPYHPEKQLIARGRPRTRPSH